MIKFKTMGDKIVKVEITRETDASVWVMHRVRKLKGDEMQERRFAKVSEYECYHDTWADAKDHLLKRAEQCVISARRQLQNENAKLGNIQGMREPADAAQ